MIPKYETDYILEDLDQIKNNILVNQVVKIEDLKLPLEVELSEPLEKKSICLTCKEKIFVKPCMIWFILYTMFFGLFLFVLLYLYFYA